MHQIVIVMISALALGGCATGPRFTVSSSGEETAAWNGEKSIVLTSAGGVFHLNQMFVDGKARLLISAELPKHIQQVTDHGQYVTERCVLDVGQKCAIRDEQDRPVFEVERNQ